MLNLEDLLEVLVQKMYDVVGAKYIKGECKKEGWYRKHKWTREQQSEFKKWAENYLYEKKDRYRAIATNPIGTITKKRVKGLVNEFVWQYGWIDETDEERRNRLRLERIKEIERL